MYPPHIQTSRHHLSSPSNTPHPQNNPQNPPYGKMNIWGVGGIGGGRINCGGDIQGIHDFELPIIVVEHHICVWWPPHLQTSHHHLSPPSNTPHPQNNPQNPPYGKNESLTNTLIPPIFFSIIFMIPVLYIYQSTLLSAHCRPTLHYLLEKPKTYTSPFPSHSQMSIPLNGVSVISLCC